MTRIFASIAAGILFLGSLLFIVFYQEIKSPLSGCPQFIWPKSIYYRNYPECLIIYNPLYLIISIILFVLAVVILLTYVLKQKVK